MKLHYQTVSPVLMDCLHKLMNHPAFRDFYLVAVHHYHCNVDIDFLLTLIWILWVVCTQILCSRQTKRAYLIGKLFLHLSYNNYFPFLVETANNTPSAIPSNAANSTRCSAGSKNVMV